ncbi:MAG: 16S rRNA (guanine(527)-N(7))-methyltransferase RsmG [Merismopedia sp. SIO2A8]|nr:16S rRNA (guanine(527)-N(7))-methyltransferase RsmG [Symploca sp. SIO2B6]NET49848.1 16S rRNA (guanine(527)-N(7))-methyltransferase RsmG [Merismopedia sp. SIO2A8]
MTVSDTPSISSSPGASPEPSSGPALGSSSLPEYRDIWTNTLGWAPSDRQQDHFQRLYSHICQGNRAFNLTRITDPGEFWEKHLWDSLSGIQPFLCQSSESIDDPKKTDPQKLDSKKYYVLDIGSGAGFPGLPIAIACPHWSVTLLDSTRKKMAFVESILPELGVNNVRTVTDRAEALGHNSDHRQRYNLVVIRAVASAAACAEYAIPFLKLNGQAVLYRGRWAEAELVELKRALKVLGGTIDEIRALSTPLTGSDRHCIAIRKVSKTPKTFPRAVGVPAKTPIS